MSHPNSHDETEDWEEEERRHFQRVVTAFLHYEKYHLSANNRRRKDFISLPLADQTLLEAIGWKEKLNQVDERISQNAIFLNKLVANPEIFQHGDEEEWEDEDNGEGFDHSQAESRETSNNHQHQHSRGHSHAHSNPTHSHQHSHEHTHGQGGHEHSHSHSSGRPSDADMDKLRSTIKQLVRDWSVEGQPERDTCYKPMLDALLAHFADTTENDRRHLRVLIPGTGLGRLAYDTAKLGFASQGNEFSHFMLLTSYFILNRTDEINQHTIYPFIHSFSNHTSSANMMRSVTIPDVLPSDLPSGSDFSLVAGDFEEVYTTANEGEEGESQDGKWNAVLTCFFLDTAKNVTNYLRIIHRLLAPGGVWINLGPLLWHYENNRTNDISIELSLDEVKTLVQRVGFTISNERTIDTPYTADSQGMLGYTYKAAFWTATKEDGSEKV